MMMRMKYVAWRPTRWGEQVAYFQEHPRVGRERLWKAAQQAMENVHGHRVVHGIRVVLGRRQEPLQLGPWPRGKVSRSGRNPDSKLLAREIIAELERELFSRSDEVQKLLAMEKGRKRGIADR